jgi:hypothetical protein
LTRISDWPAEISKGVIINQNIMEIDTEGIWPKYLPRVAATAEQIAEAEAFLGHEIDGSYASFLRAANGWPNFYQEVSLFGTDELQGGMLMKLARDALATMDDVGVFQGTDLGVGSLLPIAASEFQMDVFAMDIDPNYAYGSVAWLAGGLIERYESFDDYYLAMLDYNREDLKDLRSKQLD